MSTNDSPVFVAVELIVKIFARRSTTSIPIPAVYQYENYCIPILQGNGTGENTGTRACQTNVSWCRA